MNTEQSKQTYIIGGVMLVVGLLVGMFLTVAWYESQNGSEEENDMATSTEDINNQDENEDISGNGADNNTVDQDDDNTGSSLSFSVSAQNQVAGSQVIVPSVSVGVDTWVAVREEENGQMSNILGAKWIPAGDHVGVEVNLLRATAPGQNYYVVLYEDDGDKEFSQINDVVITAGGNPVSDMFSAN